MDRIGWEPIWKSDRIPPRYASFAAPDVNVVEWADSLPPRASVLDLGCGAGRHVIYLSERGFQVAGSDIAPSGLRRTQAACAERGVTFYGNVCDMTALPWADSTFDAVLSTSTIHHALRADLQRAIDEVWAVLKVGGLFLLDLPCTDTWDYKHLRAGIVTGSHREVEPNTFIELQPDDIDGYLPHHYCDEADLRDLLGQYKIVRLWPALRPAPPELGEGQVGKWVAWAQKLTQATR